MASHPILTWNHTPLIFLSHSLPPRILVMKALGPLEIVLGAYHLKVRGWWQPLPCALCPFGHKTCMVTGSNFRRRCLGASLLPPSYTDFSAHTASQRVHWLLALFRNTWAALGAGFPLFGFLPMGVQRENLNYTTPTQQSQNKTEKQYGRRLLISGPW